MFVKAKVEIYGMAYVINVMELDILNKKGDLICLR